jgi:hypothetical protein
VTKNRVTKCLLNILIFDLKREQAAWALLLSNEKPTMLRFGHLVIWFLVILDEMKWALVPKQST